MAPWRKALTAFVVLITSVLTLGLGVTPASAAPPPEVCQVTNAEAGGFAYWRASPGATSYVYAVRYNNGPERYGNTTEFSEFLPINNGRVTAMRVAALGGSGGGSTTCTIVGPTSPVEPTPVTPPGGGDGGGNQSSCSVETIAGGVKASWDAVADATEYAYRLEISGQANRYGRVSTTEASIAVPAGASASVSVSAVFSNGSYGAAQPCGSANGGSGSLTPADGGGNDPGTPADTGCSVQTTTGGIQASWQAVSGAVQYVYRVEVSGSPDRYGRSDTTSATIAVPAGATATVAVSGVLGNGSYTGSVQCGSAVGGTGSTTPTPENPTPNPGGTCSLTRVADGIQASWQAVSGAVQYVYRVEISGQPNRYGRVTTTSAVIPVSSGTVAVSGVLSTGAYTPAVSCGSI